MKMLLYILIIMMFFGCESEEQKKQKAQEVVQALISNIQIDNYESVFEYYPTFRDLKGKYWKHKTLNITSTILKDDGTVEIFATSDYNDQLFFLLEKIDGTYKVVKSKGISSYSNSNIYKYCKNIGCIGVNESDLDMSKICKNNESDFNYLVNRIKNKIEDKFRLENHTLIKSGGYGSTPYVSGDITVKNYSRYSIPRSTYNIYIKFLNDKDEVVFRYNHVENYSDIQYGSSNTLNVFKIINATYNIVDIELEILDTNFIEDIVGKYAEGSLCDYAENL